MLWYYVKQEDEYRLISSRNERQMDTLSSEERY